MCPPGVDQIGRTSQTWTIVVPTVKKILPLKLDAKAMYQRDHFNLPIVGEIEQPSLWDKLMRYNKTTPILRDVNDVIERSYKKGLQQSSSFLAMPVEILSNITSCLDKDDIVRLGLTSTFLLQHALSIIERDVRSQTGSWAGQPLATIGNYLEALPKSFFENGLAFKSVDRQDLVQIDKDNGKTFRVRNFHAKPARQFLWDAWGYFEDVGDSVGEGLPLWLEALNGVDDENEAGKPIMRQALVGASSINDFSRQDSASTGFYYLRNLTTNHFVRVCGCKGLDLAHIASSLPKDSETHEDGCVSLDDILIMQTRWSAPTYTGKSCNGPWAGDNFDLIDSKDDPAFSIASTEGVGLRRGRSAERPTWEDVTDQTLTQALYEARIFGRRVDLSDDM